MKSPQPTPRQSRVQPGAYSRSGLVEGGKVVLAIILGVAVGHAIVSLFGITFGLAS